MGTNLGHWSRWYIPCVCMPPDGRNGPTAGYGYKCSRSVIKTIYPLHLYAPRWQEWSYNCWTQHILTCNNWLGGWVREYWSNRTVYVEEVCEDPCLPDPCENGGTCEASPGSDHQYECDCPPQHYGEHCEHCKYMSTDFHLANVVWFHLSKLSIDMLECCRYWLQIWHNRVMEIIYVILSQCEDKLLIQFYCYSIYKLLHPHQSLIESQLSYAFICGAEKTMISQKM